MAKVNLLPWREERRKQRQQEFYVILAGAVVLGGALWLAANWHVGRLQQEQESRNQMLKNEIAVLDRRIREIDQLEAKRAQLLARKEVIEDLQKTRSQIVHLFDQIARTVPDGVRLTAMTQRSNTVTVQGFAESNAKVSAYMRSLDASPWMRNPELSITEQMDEESTERYSFSVSVTVGPEDGPAEAQEGLEG